MKKNSGFSIAGLTAAGVVLCVVFMMAALPVYVVAHFIMKYW